MEEAVETEFRFEFVMDEQLMQRKKVLPLYKEVHKATINHFGGVSFDTIHT